MLITNHDNLPRARALRRESTPAEQRLWYFLRGRRFEGAKFRRQQTLDDYIVDFYCAEAKLAIEVDGGGHVEPAQAAYDAQRTAVLERMGIRVLRFFNDEVTNDVEGVLARIGESLSPTLPLRGREEAA